MYETLFNNVLDAISDISGYSKGEIISRNRSSDLVDMRCVLFYVLYREGMYPGVIAKFMKRTAANIRDMINNYSKRSFNNKYLATIRAEVEKRLKTKYCSDSL